MTSPEPPRYRRRFGEALSDAVPDALATAACALAWIAPDALGFDLLNTTGLLSLVELPLAFLVGFAAVKRVRDPRWPRAAKIWYVLFPTSLLACASLALLGIEGLIAVTWLGARSIVQLWRDRPDGDTAVHGLWLVIGRNGARISLEETTVKPREVPKGSIVIPAGHEQLMASATIGTWFAMALLLPFLPPFGTGGATEAYALRVGWDQTLVGQWLPAHVALATGVILFAVRTFGHFERVGETAPVKIEDDEVLQEIIDKIEGKPRRPAGKRRRR
jgi:hypothetical protein